MRVTADPILAEFDRLTQQVFGASEGAGMPVDVTRRGDQLSVRFDVPGVRAEDLSLNLENLVLTVSAERHSDYADDEKVLVQERFDGKMTRRIRVPDWVDVERVTAQHVDGVLTVTLPVAEQAKPRRIEIRATTSPAAQDSINA